MYNFLQFVTVWRILYIIPVLYLVYKLTRFLLWCFTTLDIPGPKGTPVLGLLKPLTHNTLWNHADLYGDVSAFHIAGQNVVVLNKADAIRDAFLSPETAYVLSARYPTFFKFFMHDDVLFRSTYEPYWKEQRQILHTALKAYGEGITEIENVVLQELDYVKKLLASKIQEPTDIDDILAPSILNILYTLINGERYEYNDDRIQLFLQANEAANKLGNPLINAVLQTFPFLKFLPFGIGKTCKFITKSNVVFLDAALGQFSSLTDEEIKSKKGITFELLALQKSTPWLTTDMIRGCIQDIMGAGNLSTRNSLYTFFLVLLHYPHIEQNIRKEIDLVIADRTPSLNDRKDMPYTMAAILELTRYASTIPLSMPHASSKSVNFRGFTIPADSVVISNQFRVHHDDNNWANPWDFDPTRFLDSDGQVVSGNSKIRKNLLPFGIGKRMCVGETFAKTRVFLYIVSLLQSFTFERVPGDNLPSCDPRTFPADLAIHPPPYKVLLYKRNDE